MKAEAAGFGDFQAMILEQRGQFIGGQELVPVMRTPGDRAQPFANVDHR